MHFFLFFFSSRRRHTRWPRDWSSDVCSSDLQCGKRNLPYSPSTLLLLRGKIEIKSARIHRLYSLCKRTKNSIGNRIYSSKVNFFLKKSLESIYVRPDFMRMKKFNRILERIIEGGFTVSGALTSIVMLLIVVFLFNEGIGLFQSPSVEKGYSLYVHSDNTVTDLSDRKSVV